VDKLDIKIASAYLVLKLAEAEDPVQAQGPVSEIGKWWENYNKPFLDSWKQMRGDPKTNTKGDIVGAASSLYGKRPGTLLGLLGMLIGGTMGPKWAAGLGALGLGGGYLWGRRGELQPYIQKTFVKPALDDAQARFKAEMDPMKARIDSLQSSLEQNRGTLNLLNTVGNFLPKVNTASAPVSAPAPVIPPKVEVARAR
jgi:hypothetical protein